MSGYIYLASVLSGVHTLGPCGKEGRTVLWLSGCSRRCPGCISPNFQTQKPEDRIAVRALIAYLKDAASLQNGRVTISGGEPFEQPCGLVQLCRALRWEGVNDILIYTGFTLEELGKRQDADIKSILGLCDVLVDGPYKKELNDGSPMRGSSNQRIHYLSASPSLRRQYEAYRKQKNKLEIFSDATGHLQVVGIWPGENTL